MLHPPLSMEFMLASSRKKQKLAVLEFLTNTLEPQLLRLDAYLEYRPDYSSHFAAIVHDRSSRSLAALVNNQGNSEYRLLVDGQPPKDIAPKSSEWYNCIDSLWRNSACLRVFRRDTDYADIWDPMIPDKKDYADLVEIIKGRNTRIRIVPGDIAEYAQELFTCPDHQVLSTITQHSPDGKIITTVSIQQHSLPYRVAARIIKEICELAKAVSEVYSNTSPRGYME